MPAQILTTKLYIPPLNQDRTVLRPRLLAQLNANMQQSKLTLISAPAGFGKTTLVAEWIASSDNPAGWVSLDEGDSDPLRFLSYFVAALQRVAPSIGERVTAMLQSPQPPPIESILTTLLNEITTLPQRFVLVLDDYHVLDSQEIDTLLTFLIENLPPQLHLVMTTREDPRLPLARMRARGQLNELRAADLRFRPDEATGFLNNAMGLQLAPDEVMVLEQRTEGWIAGLQLAALSMQGREDVHGFIQAFAGDHRYIVDYLVEEVLQRQPPAVRGFLLETSILDRLCGPLCDAVTTRVDSSIVLEDLERSNLFVVSLDDRRLWFRYHHLFADVLRAHLLDEQPDLVTMLHQRASDWYIDSDLPAYAVQHAFAADDLERVARLAEITWSAMDQSRQFTMWLDWAQAIPDEMMQVRPVLSVGYAWALLEAGELEAGEAQLHAAEQLLYNAPRETMIVDDEAEFQRLPASIASARTYLAQAHDDTAGTLRYAQQALDLLPADDHLRRGVPASLLGIASWASGDLETAQRSFADAMTSFERAGNILFAITGTYVLADMQLAAGCLREALHTYERSLELAAAQGQPPVRGTADLYLGLGELHYEQGSDTTAAEYLQRSEELSEVAAFPRWQYRWCQVQARVRQAQGDVHGALKMLDEAERLYMRGPIPDLRPIAALKAQLWIVMGRLDAALDWTQAGGLSPEGDLSYLREFEYLTLARLLTAQYKNGDNTIDAALLLLNRLLKAAQAGRRNGSVIDILVQQALAFEAQDNIPQALDHLEQVLTLAEPEGYARLFVDEGPPMARLLTEAAARGIRPGYVRKLLDPSGTNTSSKATPTPQPLIEPLSDREVEILQLVADGLSNREISQQLFLALSTVKGHNRNIFDKLQVKRRTEAVARAREIGLII
ncbi:MAG: helix-turn-helix transcriptional regulator [Anaerolineaceae bacterium]|nr:helix-turn-helix transcriptional regulator [Anaerolineaceae bacterium]